MKLSLTIEIDNGIVLCESMIYFIKIKTGNKIELKCVCL